jgi:hypothetical protein
MKKIKLFILSLFFILLSHACLAQGIVGARMGEAARFMYVQKIQMLNGYILEQIDVTNKIPYEIAVTDKIKTLIVL